MLDKETRPVRPTVRTLTTPEGYAYLREALAWLDRERSDLFAALFEWGPGRPGTWVQAVVPEVMANALARHGLLVGSKRRGARGTVPIRRCEGRYYIQSLGLPPGYEYQHEPWPETDALLLALATLPPGRLLDLGCGTGIVAIEARARGHVVTATDLDAASLELATLNARLNGFSDLDIRRGPLWEPVGDETFDTILTNPDYGGVADQLRLEVLRGLPAHLTPEGRAVVATVLEWRSGSAAVPLEVPLGELVVAGHAVRVAPIESEKKRDWFYLTTSGGPPEEAVPSRHRFTITVQKSARPELAVRLPALPPKDVVPLARLTAGDAGAVATITSLDDVMALVGLTAALTAPEIALDGPLPSRLVDGCRFGDQPCVGPRGAAGALVEGISLRPCAHGGAVAQHSVSAAELAARYAELDAELQVRRGCPMCPAYTVCSRCLFPTPLDEASYCKIIRSQARHMGLSHRLFATIQFLDDERAPAGTLRILRGPLLPPADPSALGGDALTELARRWRRRHAWAVERGGTAFLQVLTDGELGYFSLEAVDLDLLLRLARGDGIAGVADVARAHRQPSGAVALALTRTLDRLGAE